jgi:formylglycine-generating enzyme required for sulfatase activity
MIRLSFKTLSLWLAALACLLAVPAGADQITYDMVTVGDPGNANDTGGTDNGAVNYEYQIGKYSVTIGQYTAFLNAVDPTGDNPNGIWNSQMHDLNVAGISYNDENSNGSKYSVIGPSGTAYGQTGANRPITYVSWFDAARFANWMTNGQGSGSTETGAYTLNGATTGNAVAVNPGAAFRLPTENEWYKAAYYSPNYGGVGVAGYYDYATQSDSAPENNIGSTANQANYFTGAGYSVTQSGDYDSNQNYLTDVGAFSSSGSFYGTFDQSGNVSQWNDLDGLASSGSSRGLRGGFWGNSDPFLLSSSTSGSSDPSVEDYSLGFRLASPVSSPSAVPEIDPNSLGSVLALVLGSLGLLERRRLKAA